MVCVCCGQQRAVLEPDPRLPFLRVETCRTCRDRIARWAGWELARLAGRGNRFAWIRGGEQVRMEEIPRLRAVA